VRIRHEVQSAVAAGVAFIGLACAPSSFESEQPVRAASVASRWAPHFAQWKDGSPRNGAPTSCTFSYYGGPVLTNVRVVEVNWTSNINPMLTQNLPGFYQDVTNSPYLDGLAEYSTVGLNGAADGEPGSNQTIARGSFDTAITITPSVCNTTAACTVDDSVIQAELIAQIKAGQLPMPTQSCDGQPNMLYMIDFPSNVTITNSLLGTSCGFCGYHYTATDCTLGNLAYGVFPDVSAGPCATGCGHNSQWLDNATSIHSHELAEAITDPQIGIPCGLDRPIAWYEDVQGCGEIGDPCNQVQTTLTVGADTWVVQKIWSNAANGCVLDNPSVPPLCSGAPNAPAGCRACSCADDGMGCSSTTAYCETDGTNVKAGVCVQCTTNTQCPSGTCTNSTTLTTDDTCGGCGTSGQPCCPGSLCLAPDTCGDGGTAGTCGCTALTACASGTNCGVASNDCGGVVTCGAGCTAPETCGGKGIANVCGCSPIVNCPYQCGTIPDGCGGQVTCGTCAAGVPCVGNVCLVSDGGAPGLDAAEGVDAGGIGPDASASEDGGAIGPDAGGFVSRGGGCGCNSSARAPTLAMMLGGTLARRRRTRLGGWRPRRGGNVG
jgi:hypothetical protein